MTRVKIHAQLSAYSPENAGMQNCRKYYSDHNFTGNQAVCFIYNDAPTKTIPSPARFQQYRSSAQTRISSYWILLSLTKPSGRKDNHKEHWGRLDRLIFGSSIPICFICAAFTASYLAFKSDKAIGLISSATVCLPVLACIINRYP